MIGTERGSAGGASSPQTWLAIWVVGIIACSILLLVHAYSYNYVVDDAYISFRYAQNLADGKGLIFNPGERVEGYTNFLWVMITALGVKLGMDPVGLSKALGFGFAILSMLVVFRYAKVVYGQQGLMRLAPLALLAASPPLAVWALAGLETTMFAFLVTLAVLSHVRATEKGRLPLVSAAVLVLAALTRPEGLVFAMILLLDLVIAYRLRPKVMLWLLPFLVVYLPYFIWRYQYYGYLFPNTFYAKTGGGLGPLARGLTYVTNYVRTSGGLLILMILVAPFLCRQRKIVLPLIACVTWAGYVVAIGGDGLAMYRFIVPVLGLCSLLIIYTLVSVFTRAFASSAARTRSAALGIILGLAVLLTVSNSLGSKEKDFVLEDRIRVQGNWVPIGKWLRSYAQPGESIALTTAGAVPYYSGLYTIDMLGINDAEIAHRKMPEMGKGIAGHEKHDIEYVLSRRPTYIFHYLFLVRRPVVTRDQFITDWNVGLSYLPDHPDFMRMYEPVSEQIGGYHLNFFRLKREYRGIQRTP